MAALSPSPGRVRSHTKIFFLINDLPCYLSLTRALAGLIICMESRHYQDGMGANLKRYHIYICIKNISGRSRPTHAPHTHTVFGQINLCAALNIRGRSLRGHVARGTWHVSHPRPCLQIVTFLGTRAGMQPPPQRLSQASGDPVIESQQK